MSFFRTVVAWLLGIFRAQGAATEREKIKVEETAHRNRQNVVVKKETSDAELDKRLKDGTF